MTSILASEVTSRLGQAVRDLFLARGLPVAVAGDSILPEGPATLVITDLGPGLMAGLAAAAAGLDEEQHARVAGLIAQAAARGSRIVLVSAAVQAAGTATLSAGLRDAHRIEAVLAERAAATSVILRVADVMDPADAGLRAALRGLIDGGPALRWPTSDDVQVIGLSDLAAATVAAAQSRGVEGKWFDIVHPEATSRETIRAEAGRIARLLVDPDQTETQSRPAYPPVAARRDGTAGVDALHVRPRLSVFVLLAQAIQGMIADSVRQGTIAPIRPPMPAVHRALETGALPLAGLTAVVTGATGQIGGAASRMLVRLGAHVIGVARGAEAGLRMERSFADQHAFLARQQRRLDAEHGRREGRAPAAGGPGRFRFVQADLTDRAELTALAARLTAEEPQINILLHAAGAISRNRRETRQGVEATLSLHMLAPFALTRLLATPLGQAAVGAWVINPVSTAHAAAPVTLDDLQSRLAYLPAEVLARAQAGLVSLTGALAAGMQGSPVKIAAVALDPVRTPLMTPLDEGVSGGVTAQQVAQTQRERRRMQMDTPDHAASQLIEVLVSDAFADAHGCLVTGNTLTGPILTGAEDRDLLAALWQTSCTLTGLPE